MGFKEDLQTLAIQINEHKQHITNEETTKHSLIIPFIQVLGYDVFNPLEIQPEFVSDYGKKKGSKVDYAIFKDGKPIIFIEAKPVNENLSNFDDQLAFYFNAIHEVKLGIITNGVEYRFFTDLKDKNVMDKTPFFTMSFAEIKESDIAYLACFKKDAYEKEQISELAEELAYTSAINDSLKSLLNTPSDEFIRFLIKNSDDIDITVTANVIERFKPIVGKAIKNAILEMVSKGLVKNIPDTVESKIPPQKITPPSEEVQKPQVEVGPRGIPIEATDEERAAFQIVKSILENAKKDVTAIYPRDTVNYYAINNQKTTKWFMRLVLQQEKKILAVRIDPEKAGSLLKGFTIEIAPAHLGGGSKILFNSIEDLMKMQKLILYCFDEVNRT